MKYFTLFFVVYSFNVKICKAQSSKFFLSGNFGYSSIYKVQGGIPTYYYDVKGSNVYGFAGGIKMKKIFGIRPLFEIGLETSNYYLRHYGGIADSSKRHYFEDIFKTRNTFIIAKAMVERDFFEKKLIITGGIKINYKVNEIEFKNSYLFKGLDKKNTVELSSLATDIKYGKPLLVNLNVILSTPIKPDFLIGIETSYGISYLKNIREQDFLARQFLLNLKLSYCF